MLTPHVLQLNSFGPVETSLELKSIKLPEPAEGQLLLQIEASPIHPADLNIIEGKYGRLPQLPAVIGNEGVGRVIACGKGVSNFRPGDLVLPAGTLGMWAEARLVEAKHCILLPPGLPPLQAAQMGINPSTALAMLTRLVSLPQGSWVVQNAANSAVGRCVIQIAQCLGLKTLNVVRSANLKGELERIGGNVVLTEEEDLQSATGDLCRGAAPHLALNAVGGASALALANVLAVGGTHVTYGAMARQPLKIPNGLLIFRRIIFRGFWLSHEWKSWSKEEKTSHFKQLSKWMLEGKLYLPVEKTYPLENFLAAIAHAAQEKRTGKVLFAQKALLGHEDFQGPE